MTKLTRDCKDFQRTFNPVQNLTLKITANVGVHLLACLAVIRRFPVSTFDWTLNGNTYGNEIQNRASRC